MKKKVWKGCCKILALCLLVLFFILGLNSELRIQNYEVDAETIENHIKIALLADLHSCSYGQAGSELMDRINREKPYLVMLAGDIFDDKIANDNAQHFLETLAQAYPCYYVTGNHAYWGGKRAFEEKMDILQETGTIRLRGDADRISIKGETIVVCGIDDPDASRIDPHAQPFERQIEQVKMLSEEYDGYRILLSHRPEALDQYAEAGFELVLCGHAHGGQWRIPGLINGVYAPNQGFFPQHAGGMYEKDLTTMIVSRGLSRESTRIPRFFNRPEIVMIDLH